MWITRDAPRLSALLVFLICLFVSGAYAGHEAAPDNPVVPNGHINPNHSAVGWAD